MKTLGGKSLLVLCILAGLALACNFPGAGSEPGQLQATRSMGAPAPPAEDQAQESPVETPTLQEVPEIAATATSLTNPGRIGETYEYTEWDIGVVQYQRGPEALMRIREDAPDLPEPPAGWEYALAKVSLRCKIVDEYSHSFSLWDIYMMGERGVSYVDRLMDVPARELVYSDFYTGEGYETWLDALVPVDEAGMSLVFTLRSSGEAPNETHFISLEGAPYRIPDLSPRGQPVATSFDAPLDYGETLGYDGWEIQIQDVWRGQPAEDLLREAAVYGILVNYNLPGELEDGMEYLVYQARVRYLGDQFTDGPVCMHHNDLILVTSDGTQDEQRYPFIAPMPMLDHCFLPGAEIVGFGRGIVPADEERLVLAFPQYGEQAYLSLAP